MDTNGNTLTAEELLNAEERRRVAMHLQAIENSPLTPEQIAMFEMFEHAGWSHERRRAYILERARTAATTLAAE